MKLIVFYFCFISGKALMRALRFLWNPNFYWGKMQLGNSLIKHCCFSFKFPCSDGQVHCQMINFQWDDYPGPLWLLCSVFGYINALYLYNTGFPSKTECNIPLRFFVSTRAIYPHGWLEALLKFLSRLHWFVALCASFFKAVFTLTASLGFCSNFWPGCIAFFILCLV